MTTGFGFCPNCGTPRMAADQRFCAGCGATLSPAAPSAPVEPMAPVEPPATTADAVAVVAEPPVPPASTAPVERLAWMEPRVPPVAAEPPAPPAWSMPPATPAAAQPVAPPPWSVPPSQGTSAPAAYPNPTPPGTPGAPVPAAPSAPAKPLVTIGSVNVTPKMAAIGGIALAAILVGAYLFMNMNSKPGSLTFSPSTISCSSPVSFTVTAHLPASLKSTDTISLWFDGKSAGSTPIGESGSDVNQQPDGSWLTVSTTAASEMQSACASGVSSSGFNVATPGTHTMQIRDASGKVLAEGSYTVTP